MCVTGSGNVSARSRSTCKVENDLTRPAQCRAQDALPQRLSRSWDFMAFPRVFLTPAGHETLHVELPRSFLMALPWELPFRAMDLRDLT